ncbi:hypothetical protein JHW43_003518 [Diplocarpon mali]|nr:hypothetical protein JHW43_003518 [Diplocarpon mali]
MSNTNPPIISRSSSKESEIAAESRDLDRTPLATALTLTTAKLEYFKLKSAQRLKYLEQRDSDRLYHASTKGEAEIEAAEQMALLEVAERERNGVVERRCKEERARMERYLMKKESEAETSNTSGTKKLILELMAETYRIKRDDAREKLKKDEAGEGAGQE